MLSLQFSGGDGGLAELLGDLASERPTEPFEDFVLRLVDGALDLAQFLTLMRYDEMAKPPSETLAELGRMFAEKTSHHCRLAVEQVFPLSVKLQVPAKAG
jgi:hypothetical protein